ncbi:EAL domain-containing protein [Hyphomicrobium sp. CS1GBMeth3]|uniref:putative bifunctional diguanylate cyclase/phosphodiesterase n=1 Tax=Hyphomicrobium sp. CS1GBMeth3 TaxID=1892845 RepID=UPI0009312776|nr:EAL domain-containing protein [Hyphomicrobium sp. CS1GBMeth3]
MSVLTDEALTTTPTLSLHTLQGATDGRRRKKGKTRQLEKWFDVALNNMGRGLSMFDADHRLIVCNTLYREIFDLPEALTQAGTHFADIVRYHVWKETGCDAPEELAKQQKWIASHVAELARGNSFTSTRQLKDGRTILVTNQPLPCGGWVDLQEDVTEKRKAEHQISWLARHDTLTELANRFHFREQLEAGLDRLSKNEPFAVHWIDLDRFKEVNDTLGHPVGDALLKSVARRLRGLLRGADFAARLGGDEFAIIQTGVTSEAQACTLANRLIKIVSEPHRLLGHNVSVGASVGIAIAPQHGSDPDGIIQRADHALYQAKSLGRARYCVFRPDQAPQLEHRQHFETDLRSALKRGQLELYYQPIVDPKRNEVTSFEALMRWHHPEQGLISPSDFIFIAEEMGIIVEMGAWALEEACRKAAEWPQDVRVTVNLSPVQFERGDLLQAVKKALDGSGLAPHRLELEITEGVLLRDEARTHEILHRLRDLGVSIALDDFGTAYASLSYLRSFPFDKIKIDRSFFRDLDGSSRLDCIAIINAVSALAKTMRMTTVAEGIETLDQINTALAAGCDEVQGYYFSQPVPAADVDAVLSGCRAHTTSAA